VRKPSSKMARKKILRTKKRSRGKAQSNYAPRTDTEHKQAHAPRAPARKRRAPRARARSTPRQGARRQGRTRRIRRRRVHQGIRDEVEEPPEGAERDEAVEPRRAVCERAALSFEPMRPGALFGAHASVLSLSARVSVGAFGDEISQSIGTRALGEERPAVFRLLPVRAELVVFWALSGLNRRPRGRRSAPHQGRH
jgi:hypothetical protein